MSEVKMPLFAVQTTSRFIFVGGGGENALNNSKRNGISVFSRGYLKNDFLGLFETEDKINGLEIYDKEEKDVIIDLDDENVSHNVSHKELKNINEIPKELSNAELLNNDLLNNIKLDQNYILIAAIGEKSFYLLKWTNKFELLSKIEKSFKNAILSNHLILIDGSKIYGFYDVANNKLVFDSTKNSVKLDSTENFARIYKIKIENKKLIFIPESESITNSDTNLEWNNAFIFQGKIHKVSFDKKVSTFEFDGVDAEVDGEIRKIFCKDDYLLFYTNFSQGSLLNMNGEDFRLPKITAAALDEDRVIVSTEEGDIYAFEDQKEVCRLEKVDKNITGLSLLGNHMTYTTLLGFQELEFQKKNKNRTFILWIILGLIISALLGGYIIKVIRENFLE